MRLLIVAAHADDETLGMSSLLAKHDCLLLHATGSAPQNLAYARKRGYDTREEYAAARRAELLAAMEIVGIGPDRCLECGIADQEAVLEIPRIARRVAELVQQWRPQRIYTHAYEGGHPDHDAVAAGVQLDRLQPVDVWEFAGYHFRDGVYETMRFLPGPPEESVALQPVEIERKRSMLACFRSQHLVTGRFPLTPEIFRPAPKYDFRQPPHPGQLYYETRDLGWTGTRWREAAHLASR
jgi:LmbE family N-acetylglucosaminyl deacetylase